MGLAIKVILNLIYIGERASEYKYVPAKSQVCTLDNANHVQSTLNAFVPSLINSIFARTLNDPTFKTDSP